MQWVSELFLMAVIDNVCIPILLDDGAQTILYSWRLPIVTKGSGDSDSTEAADPHCRRRA